MKSAAELSAEALAAVKAARAPELAKAWVQSGTATSGITAYDLEAPSKKLYPVITPLRNETPRVSGKGGIQANWRAITGVNTGKQSIGVAQGKRTAAIVSTTADYIAAYKGIGLEDYVEFEADYAAEHFEDIKATAVDGLLKAMMIGEEFVILAGNTSFALGNTGTVTLSSANTGGSLLGNTAYGVGCVALTAEGYYINGGNVAAGITQTVVRTNMDSTSDTVNCGTANPSPQANVTTANTGANTHCINASVTYVPGAVAYAWYLGPAAGNLVLAAITTINSANLTAAGTGTQVFSTLTASDKSTNSLIYDGLLTMAHNSSLNSYQVTQATGTPGVGTPLTGDGNGGVVEIDRVLKYLWDTWRLSPDEILVNAQEQNSISKLILSGNSSLSAARFMFNADQGALAGGIMVKEYLNKFSMSGAKAIPIKLHPNMPAGQILFITKRLPYPLSNVTNTFQIRTRKEYYQIEWPLRTRRWEYGVYADEVLQHFAPFSLAVIRNIAPS